MLRKIEMLLGTGWLFYGGILCAYYVWRYFVGTLDGVSLLIANVEGALGIIAGIWFLASLPGKSVTGMLVSLVEGFREFFYVFHTVPIDLNPDTVRGLIVLFWGIATVVFLLSMFALRRKTIISSPSTQ
jgi:hypothetical protein